MLQRSERAQFAKHIFFQSFNDVDVFVEDTAQESKKIYCEILSRAVGGQLRISQVFPIGNRNRVISKCKIDQGARKRPAVYIIDGDYDLACQIGKPALKRLYRLPRYSIENYLCDEKAIIAIISDESITDSFLEVEKKLDFPGWHSIAIPLLFDVLTCCVAAHINNWGLPTVNIPISRICLTKPDHICAQKVASMKADYSLNSISGNRAELISKIKIQLEHAVDRNIEDAVRRFLPAKTLLMPFYIARCQRRYNFMMQSKRLKTKLASRCDVSELVDIKSSIQ